MLRLLAFVVCYQPRRLLFVSALTHNILRKTYYGKYFLSTGGGLPPAHPASKPSQEARTGLADGGKVEEAFEEAFFQVNGLHRAEFVAAVASDASCMVHAITMCPHGVDRRRLDRAAIFAAKTPDALRAVDGWGRRNLSSEPT